MKSKKPKVLCEVLFQPMISWVISACRKSGIEQLCVVAGYEHGQLEDYLHNEYTIAIQTERKGTGHAVMMAEGFLKQHLQSDILVLCGDAPFIDQNTIEKAYLYHRENDCSATIITAVLENPAGYGRIIRDGGGVSTIVEEKEADENQKAVKEVNSGAYWFKAADLLEALTRVDNRNAKGEYYLTDTVSILREQGKTVGACRTENANVILGANDRRALYELTKIANRQVIDRHFDAGVEFVSLDGVLIGNEVEIGAGTTILPGTILKGKTVIGENCVIGPHTLIEDSCVGEGTKLNAVQVYQSKIHSDVKIGPFCHIRPNSEIKSGVKIGDFVEVKNSVIDKDTAVAHLTYVGDSDVGKNVNFGCGCVTVNYDGSKKNRTTIKDNAFIGCNTNLIAPVTVGEGAYTAAGSTITKNVPDGALGIERAQQVNKEGFAQRKLKKKGS